MDGGPSGPPGMARPATGADMIVQRVTDGQQTCSGLGGGFGGVQAAVSL